MWSQYRSNALIIEEQPVATITDGDGREIWSSIWTFDEDIVILFNFMYKKLRGIQIAFEFHNKWNCHNLITIGL